MTRIICLFLMLFSFSASAAQLAIVKRTKAVIYADRFMTAPIGTLSLNKKIKVSDNSQYRGLVFAIVISGRIAYVRSEDISILNESSGISNEGLIGYDTYDNHIYVMGSMYNSNYELNKYSPSETQVNGQFFTGFDLKWQRRYTKSSYFRLGFEYMSFSSGVENMQIPSFSSEYIYEFINMKRWRVRAAVGFSASPLVPYEVDPYFKLDGLSYSYSFNFEGLYFYKQRWFYTAMIGFRSLKLFDFAMPTGIENFSPTLNGYDFKFGIGWSF